MVEVVDNVQLDGDIRNPRTSRYFPQDELDRIVSAIEAVDDAVFLNSQSGHELVAFDDGIASGLPDYEYEHAPESGRNPACKLWEPEFDHSVDLYNPRERIAVEIEKSERKRVSDDLLKFIRGGMTDGPDGRKLVEFGCLIVPTNYRGKDNIYGGVEKTLQFMQRVMFVEDVAVIGYRDPRGVEQG